MSKKILKRKSLIVPALLIATVFGFAVSRAKAAGQGADFQYMCGHGLDENSDVAATHAADHLSYRLEEISENTSERTLSIVREDLVKGRKPVYRAVVCTRIARVK